MWQFLLIVVAVSVILFVVSQYHAQHIRLRLKRGTPASTMLSALVIIVFLLPCILCTVSTEFRSARCPYHCVCSDVSLNCTNGFEIDGSTLRLVSTDIEIIIFSDFVIRELSSNLFQPFSQLRSLTFIESRVRDISPNAFTGLAALNYLSLSRNHIVELPETVFSDLQTVFEIDLSGNLLEYLPEMLFSNQTSSLRTLNLSRNRIRMLSPNLFNSLTHLEHLDLSSNELSHILPRTFSFLSRVRYIILNDNLIVTVKKDLFDSNNQTIHTTVSMLRNPLECNCGLVWLREVLLGQVDQIEVEDGNSVLCSSPHIYHNQPLNDVPLEELNCTSPTASIMQSQGLHFYGNEVNRASLSWSFYLLSSVKTI